MAVKNFALIGAAGYIAPRHLKAIKAVGGNLKVAFDPKDSVGVLDSYFPDADFFVEFERFDRHVDKLRRRGEKIDYSAICSPNYLHDAHCRFALRSDIDAICEKPLVLNPWNIDALAEIERETGRRISTVLQLRLHPAVAALKAKVEASKQNEFAVDLTYITSRGRWYHASWKGDKAKSGGIATNIGVHFFDMLVHVFGPVRQNIVQSRDDEHAAGYLECGRARIRWFLSVDRRDLPPVAGERASYRSLIIDGETVDFSDGFTDLHTLSYQEIMNGRGFGIDEVRPSIEIVSQLRQLPVEPQRGERHPMVGRHVSP
ncbi:MAG: Gfo/Idh/MocA family oxidoreductase [Xanthobacteraceae bacterium]|nr:Gfo/Idh/MocA family oxidoreductase [Xanthobacteraceae bacterium]